MKINKAQKYIKGSFDLISSVRKVYYEAISLFLAVGAITETAQNNPDIEIFITFTYLDQPLVVKNWDQMFSNSLQKSLRKAKKEGKEKSSLSIQMNWLNGKKKTVSKRESNPVQKPKFP